MKRLRLILAPVVMIISVFRLADQVGSWRGAVDSSFAKTLELMRKNQEMLAAAVGGSKSEENAALAQYGRNCQQVSAGFQQVIALLNNKPYFMPLTGHESALLRGAQDSIAKLSTLQETAAAETAPEPLAVATPPPRPVATPAPISRPTPDPAAIRAEILRKYGAQPAR